ncbi:hypothetical protein [Streptomyces glomeratus]|uniref:Uncharacterized protein n=1 Tax=Streptomyces glomeratus TaxID=284452 RepID=A0ABP6M565_9ACTN|nr:hypothetical protein [Streptomyces glomeratus]MCF1510466.1 hypothetical protein [Streptomyces glomeratus]
MAKRAARTLLVLAVSWAAWAVLFFAPIPYVPKTSFFGYITAIFAFFAIPAIALKQTRTWRDGGQGQAHPSPIPPRLLGFSRHVPLLDDGRGVTYRITKGARGPQFSWWFDHGVPADDLMITIKVKEHLTRIETELGLPVTFPYLTPAGKEEARKRAEREQPTLEQLQEAAASGDALAKLRLWGRTGEAVTDADQLKIDTYYHLGFDIGRYVRNFEGRQWEGTQFEDDEDNNEHGTWHVFDVAESTTHEGARIGSDEIRTSAAEGSPSLRTIPASQEEAASVHKAQRAAHLAWEARRQSR